MVDRGWTEMLLCVLVRLVSCPCPMGFNCDVGRSSLQANNATLVTGWVLLETLPSMTATLTIDGHTKHGRTLDINMSALGKSELARALNRNTLSHGLRQFKAGVRSLDVL